MRKVKSIRKGRIVRHRKDRRLGKVVKVHQNKAQVEWEDGQIESVAVDLLDIVWVLIKNILLKWLSKSFSKS